MAVPVDNDRNGHRRSIGAQPEKSHPMEAPGTTSTPVDGAYSWLILLVAFLLNLTMNAGAGGMGVIMVELMHHFSVRRSVIFWIGGIMVSVGFLLSFLIGWLIKRFGCRLTGCLASLSAALSLVLASFAQSIAALYVTYGFMLGLSVTFYWNIASIIVQQYFEKRRTLAQGTLMSGLSGGLFIWPPITCYMMDEYGWRGAMLLHAGIQLHGVALCALIRPFPKPSQESHVYRPIYRKPATDSLDQQQHGRQSTVLEVEMGEAKTRPNNGGAESDNVAVPGESTEFLESVTFEPMQQDLGEAGQQPGPQVGGCNSGARCFRALFKVLLVFPHYLLYMLAVVMVQTGNVMPYTLTPARADALGIDAHRGALLVTISAGVSGVCRILCGLLADHPAINRLVLCGLAGIVAGSLTAISSSLTTFFSLAVVFGIIGVPSAAFMATFGSAAVDIVGKKYVQQGIGLMSVSFGIAQLSTFLGTGWLNDLLGDPKYAFLLFGVMEAVGGIVFLGVYFVDQRFRQNSVPVPTTANKS